jgi:hypothetical protein
VASKLNGLLRLSYYIVAFTAAKIWCHTKLIQGKIVLFDRSIIDFSSDLTRSRIPHIQLPSSMVRALLPRGTFLYIDASPEVVIVRKGELTLDRASRLAARYDRTVQTTGIVRLNGNKSVESVFAAFLDAVTEKTMQRIYEWGKP